MSTSCLVVWEVGEGEGGERGGSEIETREGKDEIETREGKRVRERGSEIETREGEGVRERVQ